jgi:hypothetical protein
VAKGDFDISSEYSRNARLKPAFLVAVPVAALAASWGLSGSVLLGIVSGPLAAAGLTYLFAHLSRDSGQKKQEKLFESWGGKPSIRKLRHRDTTLNPHTRARYHQKAAELLGKVMPTPAEEAADPAAADLLYGAYSNLLLERTRETKTHRLLFEELIGYGFRRNLYGMKSVGVFLTSLCTGLESLSLLSAFRTTRQLDTGKAVFLALDLFLLFCWLFTITPNWVKRASDSYAEQLLAASENLAPVTGRPASTKNSDPKPMPSRRRSKATNNPAPAGGSDS